MLSYLTGLLLFLSFSPIFSSLAMASTAKQNQSSITRKGGIQEAIRYGLQHNRFIRSFRLKVKGASTAIKGPVFSRTTQNFRLVEGLNLQEKAQE